MDLVISSIKERFDQPGYDIYKNLEELLLKTLKKEENNDCFLAVTNFYGSDLNPNELLLQLNVLQANFPPKIAKSATIFDVKDYILSLSPLERGLMSEICSVLQLFLVMPSTNATSERTFSALRRIKTYLRSTMSQERLNNLLTLHVHQNYTDSLDLVEIANEFITGSESRLSTFGKFTGFDQLSQCFCMNCKHILKCDFCKK